MELLSYMFEISCIESFHFYHYKMDKICVGVIELKKLITEKKVEVLKKIKEIIFEKCTGDTKSILYEDFFKLFKEYYNEGVLIISYFFLFLVLICGIF
jgi:hypothetical protein